MFEISMLEFNNLKNIFSALECRLLHKLVLFLCDIF